MNGKIRFLAGNIIITAIIAFSSITLQGTNPETTTLLRIGGHNMSPEHGDVVMHNLSSKPLAFTENRGQWDKQVLFRANAGGATMWLARDGAYYHFTRRIPRAASSSGRQMSTGTPPPAVGSSPRDRLGHEPDDIEQLVIKASFVGANPNPTVVGEEMMGYKCNYFLGNEPSSWRTDVANYRAVRFKDIYPGIELKYYGNGRQMEYDFIVSPGADFSQIRVSYDGCNSLAVNEHGELVVETEWGTVIEQRPIVYQIDRGRAIPLQGAFVVSADKSFGFALGEKYNPALPLVIDPVLIYSTYLGGADAERGYAIAVDDSNNVYVTGYTASNNFPTEGPYLTEPDSAGIDAFVTKLNAAGDSLIYSTYLGGTDEDRSTAIAVDGDGSVYVTGFTASSDFPTEGPYQTDTAGVDVFVAKLNAAGDSLIYSTYLGGDSDDEGHGIAVDGHGNAYISGWTNSSDFPTQDHFQTDQPGTDAFVTKLNIAGDGLVYSTYLGGAAEDASYAIAVGTGDNAYITGWTYSSDFPTLNPYQLDQPGGDVFVTKLNSAGNGLEYSTYLGGDGFDDGYGIAVDDSGNAYVTGATWSADFPTQGSPQTDQPFLDAFVTKLNGAGDSLVYSTYLGGNAYDWGYAVAVDDSGNAYVAGRTNSSDFPTQDSLQPDQLHSDGFVTKLNGAGNELVFSTYLGGGAEDESRGIAIDRDGNVYVTGMTGSNDFPIVNGYQMSQSSDEVFVVKIDIDSVVAVDTTSIFEEFDETGLADFTLYQNHPNPFNTATTISFEISTSGPVKLEIFNILGRRVIEWQLKAQAPGLHTFRWNGLDRTGKEIPSGIYFYRVSTGRATQARKMVLLK